MERSIHLLGLSTSQVAGRKSTDLTFHETEFVIPTDGITMSAVCSTPSGRTFMCGSDGNLHELIYRTDEGWFTKRTGIVNWTGGGGGLGIFAQFVPLQLKGKTEDKIVDLALDPSRSVLYALTANSCIELFMIGPTDQLTRIAKVADVGRSAMMLAPGAQGLLEPRSFAIMSLSPVGRAEGDTGAQMVAVTSKGSSNPQLTDPPLVDLFLASRPQASGSTSRITVAATAASETVRARQRASSSSTFACRRRISRSTGRRARPVNRVRHRPCRVRRIRTALGAISTIGTSSSCLPSSSSSSRLRRRSASTRSRRAQSSAPGPWLRRS